MFKADNIYKSFGDKIVLRGISFELEKGKIYTLIGGNGSGKTTLFNIITGFIKPDKGKVEFKDFNLCKKTAYKINRLGISRTFQDLRIIQGLTVRENILLALKGHPGENILSALFPQMMYKETNRKFVDKANEIIDRIYLKEVADNLAGEISYGQQKLLTLGCCLASDPELYLLDEPISGIDTENYKNIIKIVEGLKKEGKTILQVEHDEKYINQTSDKILTIENGVINTNA